MQTIAQLRLRGFTAKVAAAPAVGCTELSSTEPFFYYNPRFALAMADIAEGIKPAACAAGGFSMVVAGEFGDADKFPFVIIDSALMSTLNKAYADYDDASHEVTLAQTRAQAAERDFLRALRSAQGN
jgi:hypothetical protein